MTIKSLPLKGSTVCLSTGDRVADKRLGQHFLHDANIIAKIVHLINPSEQDHILEIGPGPGALTGPLHKAAPAFLAVLEKDLNLAFDLKLKYPGLAVIAADALHFSWEKLGNSCSWKIVGNLPYNVASPIMWEICSRVLSLDLAVFMIQKEVALRLTATPGHKNYGALSVWTQSFVRSYLAFTVPATVFWPRPKVDSAVVVFEPKMEKLFFNRRSLAVLLNLCFQKRRKQLGNILKELINQEIIDYLAGEDLDLHCRPEELSPGQFQHLSMFVDGRRA